ncbi:MAG TPA: FxsA family protein [Sporolactobacillaceae bacterium]|nr:FxsA family protein [Sporolactobacillaceae bacterium]
MKVLIPLFILVPIVEIWLFVLSGRYIGLLPTLAIVLLMSFVGAWLAKREGIGVWNKARESMRSGRLPGEELLEGVCVLAGGLLLLTPGYLTDAMGLLLLIPSVRKRVVRRLRRWLKERLTKGKGQFSFYFKR